MVTSGREMHARPDRRGVRSVVCACCFETTPNLEPDMAAMVRTLHVGSHHDATAKDTNSIGKINELRSSGSSAAAGSV